MANKKRLIELAEALRMIQNSREDCPETSITGRAIWNTAHLCALSCLSSCPTVDAVEVVHGRWLKLSPWNNHTQSCLCLNCDSISYQKKSGVYIGKIPNYCPNCGAKMDGDGNG